MKSKYVFFAGLGLLVLSFVIAGVGAYEVGESIGAVSVLIIIFGFPVAGIIELCVRYRELEEKRKARLAKIKAERAVREEEHRKEWQHREIERQKKNRIVEVKYLGTGKTTQKRGGLGGFLLGGLFGGPIGAVVGAAIPENGDALQRFAVKYADGRVVIKDLHPNSWEYKELVKYVKWEDL